MALFHWDRSRKLRAAPKLRMLHLRPTPFKKMRVKLATQVMSRSVAAAMVLYADLDILPPESRETAAALLKLNDLLDVLNSSSRLAKCFHKRAISQIKPVTAEKHLQLLREADQWLGKWVVGDGSVRVHSIGGLRQTIRGVQSVWDRCVEAGCEFLCTRRLNQDPLENMFGMIRQRGGCMDNPDPTQFRHGYKHVVINHMMAAPPTANCEADSDGLIVGLNMTAARPERASARPMARLRSDDRVMPEPKVVLDVPVDEVTANCLSYVAGYLVHKANVVCRNCERALVRVDSEVRATADVLTALKSHTGVTKCDVGSLKLPSAVLFEFVRECCVSFSVHARSMLFETKILERLVRCVLASKPATVLASQLRCHPRVLTGIAARYMRLMPVSEKWPVSKFS
ncbi:Transposable element P transposase [Amphibalanus amphitrite]|uniref:Transposable element P transposase n=1 Tax=Amphibalanus amphitrite TaxID=1232801 RepID=A0A6A4WFQ5_AMPAM|nr:Transposable element P transposase [Amphibalanus amphitrite]